MLGVPCALDKRSEAPGELPERWISALETLVSFQTLDRRFGNYSDRWSRTFTPRSGTIIRKPRVYCPAGMVLAEAAMSKSFDV